MNTGNKRKDIQIYIMSHKKADFVLDNNLFTPIETGSYYNKLQQYDIRDIQDKDNISQLNPIYLESTSLYFIYKHLLNDKNLKYIGVNQHRRQFEFDENTNFDNLFNKYDIILHKEFINGSILAQYDYCHNINDLTEICNIILRKYKGYENIISNLNFTNILFTNCCFIAPINIFKEYCSFFFDIAKTFLKEKNISTVEDALKYAETIVEIKNKNKDKYKSSIEQELLFDKVYQCRIIGYLQERIFTIWVLKNINQNKILNLSYRNINTNYNMESLIK